MENNLLFFIEIFLLLFIVVFFLVIWKIKRRKLSASVVVKIVQDFYRIQSIPQNNLKILEADKLLDFVLKKSGYTQPSLGEKLKKAGSRFSDLSGLWGAHKLRNRIAHEVNFQLNNKETNLALRQFARAFEDLGVNIQK